MKEILDRLKRKVMRLPPDSKRYVRSKSIAWRVRGRVHRSSVIRGGEVSVVIRFGIEAGDRMDLPPGTVVELCEVGLPVSSEHHQRMEALARKPADFQATVPSVPGEFVILQPDEDARQLIGEPCNCGRTEGHPHEPDCIWWNKIDAERAAQKGA